MALVFQYGSNTSSGRFNSDVRLRGDAKDLGLVCTVDPFVLDFDVWSSGNGCAAANIRGGSGRSVYGVLYEVPDYLIERKTAGQDRRSLDAIEGEHYERRPIQVRRPEGTPITDAVITYMVVSPRLGLRTSFEYASYIIAGLRDHGAPDEYLTYVKERVIANNPNLTTQISSL